MVDKNLISPDEIRILRNVVDLFVQSGEPVSSRTIKSRFRLAESTAHIRGVLHRLEEMGLLCKPHISAGRIPTDRGYRLYVDEIGAANALSRPIAERVRRRVVQDWNDVRDVMAITSQLLSELTNYMGLSMGIMHSHSVVERLAIVQLEARGGLIVLSLLPGMVRKVYVEFSEDYPSYVVDRAVRMINERIAGHPLDQAPERLEAFLREAAGIDRDIVEAVSRESGYLFDWPYDYEYCYMGIEKQVGNQELKSPKMLQNLLRLMGERSIMLNVLKGRMTENVSVTIGSENKVRELEDFAVVTRRFRTADCDGLLGVLGPTRMAYRLVLALLDRTAEELHHVHISEE
ncbi:MAG: heat-inducible transcriptional repressor HrcA [Candidatus Krumholzibacteria bacterium]|nr:heat-inducible transcriptional repressor HrcA [Candidatus Krumholzibacteria bacterium]